jgi:hypothetical protein
LSYTNCVADVFDASTTEVAATNPFTFDNAAETCPLELEPDLDGATDRGAPAGNGFNAAASPNFDGAGDVEAPPPMPATPRASRPPATPTPSPPTPTTDHPAPEPPRHNSRTAPPTPRCQTTNERRKRTPKSGDCKQHVGHFFLAQVCQMFCRSVIYSCMVELPTIGHRCAQLCSRCPKVGVIEIHEVLRQGHRTSIPVCVHLVTTPHRRDCRCDVGRSKSSRWTRAQADAPAGAHVGLDLSDARATLRARGRVGPTLDAPTMRP